MGNIHQHFPLLYRSQSAGKSVNTHRIWPPPQYRYRTLTPYVRGAPGTRASAEPSATPA